MILKRICNSTPLIWLIVAAVIKYGLTVRLRIGALWRNFSGMSHFWLVSHCSNCSLCVQWVPHHAWNKYQNTLFQLESVTIIKHHDHIHGDLHWAMRILMLFLCKYSPTTNYVAHMGAEKYIQNFGWTIWREEGICTTFTGYWWTSCVWPFLNTSSFQKFFTLSFYWVHRRRIFVVHTLVITVHSKRWLCINKLVNTLCLFLWCHHFQSSTAAQPKIWN
jgi:hypothetical protein